MNTTRLTGVVLFALTSSVIAQTATYQLYGEGCNGAAPANCLTLNDLNPTHQLASLPNEYAYPVINTTGLDIQVIGFEIYTTTNTGITETGKTGLIWDLSGPTATVHTRPDPTNIANGTITVANAAGWYSTALTPPIVVPAGVAFWFHVDAYSRIAPPQHTAAGGVAGPTQNWYRRPNNNMVWTASVSVARQIFRIHCVPATPAVPYLTATGLPQFGQTLTLNVAGGVPNLPAFLVWALDNTQWFGQPTPVDLTAFGAPNCFNRTSTDEATFLVLDGSGAASSGSLIPNSPSLGGLAFFNQVAVLSPGTNTLGLLVGNAGAGVVGN
ncbi:MAG: hypothetical protein IPK26_10335 [Planctomycetes bacterium]|nr:hypothetical protein [Planctomycetota bacterium]